MKQPGGFRWNGSGGGVVIGLVAKGTESEMKAMGWDGFLTEGTVPLQENAMDVAGEQVSAFPIQAVVGDALLQAERTDLGGQVGEEKASEQSFFQSWASNRRVIRDHFWL
nr:hypothetical protein [Dictyobacter arantiisoli]